MTLRNHLGLPFFAAIRALALIVVVVVVGFGGSLHAHGAHSDDHGTQIGVHADAAHDASEAGTSVSILPPTHCGGGAVCVAAVPSASVTLLSPEAGRAQFATVTRAAPPSPTFGLLRPPRQG